MRVVRQAAEDAGRDPQQVRIVSRGVVRLHAERDKPLTGSAAVIPEDLAALAEAGVSTRSSSISTSTEGRLADDRPF